MPKIDVNKKRGYEASVPVEKIWNKIENGEIDCDFCVPLGENEKKEDRFFDLEKSMHILAAGETLSGVGMFRRVALATLLKFHKPEDLKLILVDPLKISFSDFKNIDDYLLFPIITEVREAIEAFEWVVCENNRRFQLLIEKKTKNIRRYSENNPKIPRIIIMISEFGELMMHYDRKKVEALFIHMTQSAKASGIHLIITTQRPSEEVLTPLIKSNTPSKIAFKVPSANESRIIFGKDGAEKLLGQGDMLVYSEGTDSKERMQGYCIELENEKWTDLIITS